MKYLILILAICFAGCFNGSSFGDCSASERTAATAYRCERSCAQKPYSSMEMYKLCINACKADNADWFKAICKRP